MDNAKAGVPKQLLFIFIAGLTLLNLIVMFFSHAEISAMVLFVFIIPAGSALWTLIAMVMNRLITTRWGNFLKGWLIFLVFIEIMAFFFFINNQVLIFIFVVLLSILGTILFIQLGNKWEFTSASILNLSILNKIWTQIVKITVSLKKGLFILIPNLVKIWQGLIQDIVKVFKKKSVLFGISGLVILIAAILIITRLFLVTVSSYSPKGEVSLSTEVKVRFSDKVEFKKEDLEELLLDNKSEYSNVTTLSNRIFIKSGVEYFKITPTVKGYYVMEGSDTIIFIPNEQLKPSTQYHVEVKTDRLSKKGKMVFGKGFRFKTPDFKVIGVRLFYNYELLNHLEKEVVGEINFNVSVNSEELKKFVTMKLDGNDLGLTIEPSNIPTRFYIKSGKIQRQKVQTSISVTVRKGLTCINGQKPLQKDYTQNITLPETEKLAVIKAEQWPVSGNTYLSLLFNRPISAQAVNNYVTIELDGKNVPYNVETEYCYAVLKADFKPNRDYQIHVAKGMSAENGLVLEKDFEYNINLADMNPEVRFTAQGSILPLNGNMDLELYTLNLDKFNVKIDKIFRNNLVYFLHDRYNNSFIKALLYKSFDVEGGDINDKVTHYINLKKFHNMEYKGLYRITLSGENGSSEEDDEETGMGGSSKVVLCTDLGIIAKHSGKDLLVKIYSIQGLNPVAGATLKLVSYENQVMSSGVSDSSGEYVFKDWKENEQKFTPFILIAEKEDDFSYLQFNVAQLDQYRFGIGGKTASKEEMQAFLTPERGVYRPGETAYITAIVRNGDLTLPPQVDVQLIITDPTGQKFAVYKKKIQPNGMMDFEVPFPSYAKTGQYEALLKLGDQVELGRTALKIEEFIPDKIKVDIVSGITKASPDKPITFKVKGLQLFGPPAVGNRVHSRMRFSSRIFSHSLFTDYTFADSEREYQDEYLDLGETTLNNKGEAEYSVDVPPSIYPPSALNALVLSEVYDEGGRAVSAVKNFTVDRYPVYYGIKVNKKDVYLQNEPLQISYVAIDPDGNYQKSKNVSLFIKHKVFYSILKKYSRSKEDYESDSYEEAVYEQAVNIDGKGSLSFTPKAPGYYYVYLGDDNGMRTLQKIYVQGNGLETIDMGSAENVSITFNKEKYNPGDTAVVTIHSAIPGKLFFSVERDKVLMSRTLDLVNNKAVISVPVSEEYVPNVYISAYVIRTPDPKLRALPMSALGIKTLQMNPGTKKMLVNIVSAEQTRSQDGIDVNVHMPNPGANCGVVLAAVDEGILQLTQFETPDPFNFFYDKRGLLTQIYSIFDAVLPDVKANKLAIGGDSAEFDMSRRHINPVDAKRVKSLALYSKVLQPDVNGDVRYHFKLPPFNGRVRIMALAADEKRFGSSEKDVTVSDPIVLSPSYPRIMAPGDSIEIPVRIYNRTGKTIQIKVTLSVAGPVLIKGSPDQTINLESEGQKELFFSAQAKIDAGKALFTMIADGGGVTSKVETELAVRPGRTLMSINKYGQLKGRYAVNIDVPAGLIPYGQKIRVSSSSKQLTKFIGALDYLIVYPYGCAEQTASAILPMIYYKELAEMTGFFSGKSSDAEYFVQESIKKLEGFMLPDGHFSTWPGITYYNDYTSFYVSYCLLEADRLGYIVDPNVISNIYKSIGLETTVKKGRLDRREKTDYQEKDVYVLYLRALINKADKESMDYLKDNMLKDMNYVDRCQLAVCYSLIGDNKTATAVLPNSFVLKYFPRVLGGDYDSQVKRYAIYLNSLVQINPKDDRIPSIVETLEKSMQNGRFGNTHECSLALTAIAKVYESEPAVEWDVDLLSNGKLLKSMDNNMALAEESNLSGSRLTLTNKSTNTIYYNILAEGVPLENSVKPLDQGLEIKREYFDSEGKPLNLSSVRQGDLVVATINLKTKGSMMDNLVIVDMLPAGFEIENSRLNSRGSLSYTPPSNWMGLYDDIRDDRLILFTGTVTGEFNYSYTLRAVTVGEYIIPQIYAEAMYDPDTLSVGKPLEKLHVVRAIK